MQFTAHLDQAVVVVQLRLDPRSQEIGLIPLEDHRGEVLLIILGGVEEDRLPGVIGVQHIEADGDRPAEIFF